MSGDLQISPTVHTGLEHLNLWHPQGSWNQSLQMPRGTQNAMQRRPLNLTQRADHGAVDSASTAGLRPACLPGCPRLAPGSVALEGSQHPPEADSNTCFPQGVWSCGLCQKEGPT